MIDGEPRDDKEQNDNEEWVEEDLLLSGSRLEAPSSTASFVIATTLM